MKVLTARLSVILYNQRCPAAADYDQQRNHLKSFLRDQKGTVAAIAAVSLVVILGFGAFGIDMSLAK